MEKFYNINKSKVKISKDHEGIYRCVNVLINHDVHFNELERFLKLLKRILIDDEIDVNQKNKMIMAVTDKYFHLYDEFKNEKSETTFLLKNLYSEIKLLLSKMV